MQRFFLSVLACSFPKGKLLNLISSGLRGGRTSRKGSAWLVCNSSTPFFRDIYVGTRDKVSNLRRYSRKSMSAQTFPLTSLKKMFEPGSKNVTRALSNVRWAWRLYNLYPSPNWIKTFILRQMNLAKNTAQKGNIRNAYIILVRKT